MIVAHFDGVEKEQVAGSLDKQLALQICMLWLRYSTKNMMRRQIHHIDLIKN